MKNMFQKGFKRKDKLDSNTKNYDTRGREVKITGLNYE